MGVWLTQALTLYEIKAFLGVSVVEPVEPGLRGGFCPEPRCSLNSIQRARAYGTRAKSRLSGLASLG
jgi:hypothetical protein